MTKSPLQQRLNHLRVMWKRIKYEQIRWEMMDLFLPEGIVSISFYFVLFLNVFSLSLPPEVVRRVNALRNLQVDHHKIEASFFEEVHALECRYLSKYQPLYEKVRRSLETVMMCHIRMI